KMIYAVFAPLLFALLLLLVHKLIDKFHIGYIVVLIPLSIFAYFVRFFGSHFEPIKQTTNLIPSLKINFTFYLYVLSLIFFLLLLVHMLIDKFHILYIVVLIPLSIFAYFVRFVGSHFEPIKQTTNWIPSLNINFTFYLDGLSLLFVLLISGIGTLVVFYSIFYLTKQEKLTHFYIFLLLFMTAMLGTVLSDNVFVLYTFWEFTSISSFLLIGFWHYKERSRYGALKSMLITVFGGLSLFGGF